MSRSRKKTPILSHTTATSEKEAKRQANRALRRRVNTILATWDFDEDSDDLIFPEMREVSNIWAMPKDGKAWYNLTDLSQWLCDDPERFLRK